MLVKFKSKEFWRMISDVAVRKGKVRLQTFLNEIEQFEVTTHEVKVYWRNSEGRLESNTIKLNSTYSDKADLLVDIDKLEKLKVLDLSIYTKAYPHKWSRGIECMKLNSYATRSALPILHEFTKLKSLSCEVDDKLMQFPQNIASQLECYNANCLYELCTLKDMSNLKELRIRSLMANDFADMPHLEKLTLIAIVNSQLNDFDICSKMPDLDYVCINNSFISDLSFVTKLPKLTYLCVSHANLSSIEPLKGSSIEVLEVDNNMIEDISPIADMNLTYLRITNNPIADLSALSNQKDLELLHFKSTMVTDISPILKLKNLKEISLDVNNLSDVNQIKSLKAKPTINGKLFDDFIKDCIDDSQQDKTE